MPFSHKVSFLRGHKSHHAASAIARTLSPGGIEGQKQRSNSQRPHPFASDDLQAEKLFHTIHGVGTSSDLNLPCTPRNHNWAQLEQSVLDLFSSGGQIEPGKLKLVHENIMSLLESDFGILVFDRLKSQVLPKAVCLIKERIDENRFLESLESLWQLFFHKILSTLECMLFAIEAQYSTVSIRKTTLIIFRDQILVNCPIEEKLKERLRAGEKISGIIVHMILVVQSVQESYPPSKQKLAVERIAALSISPYLGYYGLYSGHTQSPVVHSGEPDLNALRPRSFDTCSARRPLWQQQQQTQHLARKISPAKALQPPVTQRTRKISLQASKPNQSLNYLMGRVTNKP